MSKKNSKSSEKKAKKVAKKTAAKSGKASKKVAKKNTKKSVKAKSLPKKNSSTKKLKVKKVVAKKVVKAKVDVKNKKKAVKKVTPNKKITAKKPIQKKAIKAKAKVAPKKSLKPAKGKVTKVAVAKKTSQKPIKIASKAKGVSEKKTISPPVAKPIIKNKPVTTIASVQKQQTPPVVIDRGHEKNQAEPAGKFELEYVIHSSPNILFEFLVSPSGLSEWFCDDVNIRNEAYTFFWDGAAQPANLVKLVEEKLVRFQWLDKKDGSYFEFRIEKDELTNDTSLIITDFAETPEEQASSKLLWDSQIDKLLHVLGSYF